MRFWLLRLDSPFREERDPVSSCQTRISKLSWLFSPSTKTEARFDDDKIEGGLEERGAMVVVVVIDDGPLTDAVNDEEVPFVTLDTFVRVKEDVVIAVTD